MDRVQIMLSNNRNTYWFALAALGAGAACAIACSGSTAETGGGSPSAVSPEAGALPDLPTYIPPTEVCRPSLAGEPAGRADGGVVCTKQSVAGATEEGRRFRDYADCNVVRTQRPYYPRPPSPTYAPDDPRMKDAAYAKELGWIRAQLNAVGCSCCHSNDAPQGPVRFSLDMPGNWITSMSDRDVALLANWLDTGMFERWSADENNGFARPHGVVSTDPVRMEGFFVAEARHRGLTPAQFVNEPPTGGPLLEQQSFVPGRCAAHEGVDATGLVTWTGGPARYVYVLTPSSKNPTVPPDRDTPSGTLWRLDVAPDRAPLDAGTLRYGATAPGAAQRVPGSGQAPALEVGRDYYLYVTRDYYQPITRCVFTFGR